MFSFEEKHVGKQRLKVTIFHLFFKLYSFQKVFRMKKKSNRIRNHLTSLLTFSRTNFNFYVHEGISIYNISFDIFYYICYIVFYY